MEVELSLLIDTKKPLDLRNNIMKCSMDTTGLLVGASPMCRDIIIGILQKREGDRSSVSHIKTHRWLSMKDGGTMSEK